MPPLPPGEPHEVFPALDYPAADFFRDLYGAAYHAERSGPARKPRGEIQDRGRMVAFEVNTDAADVRVVKYFSDRYEDIREAVARLSVFGMVVGVLRDRWGELARLDLVRPETGGPLVSRRLVERLLRARRLSDGERSWLDGDGVEGAISGAASEGDDQERPGTL